MLHAYPAHNKAVAVARARMFSMQFPQRGRDAHGREAADRHVSLRVRRTRICRHCPVVAGNRGRSRAESARLPPEARVRGYGPDRDRTGDLLNAIQARSQLRYRPTSRGAGTGDRNNTPEGRQRARRASLPRQLIRRYWLIVPFDETVIAYPGSSPLPGVVAFWINRTSFANTFRVTAPVGFSSHEF